jgi:ribonuclease HI
VHIRFDGSPKAEQEYLWTKCKMVTGNIKRFKLNPIITASVINTKVIPIIRYPFGSIPLETGFLNEIGKFLARTVNKSPGTWSALQYDNIFAPTSKAGLGLIKPIDDYHCSLLDKLIHHGINAQNELTSKSTLTMLRLVRNRNTSKFLLERYKTRYPLTKVSVITAAAGAIEKIEEATNCTIQILSHNYPDFLPHEEIVTYLSKSRYAKRTLPKEKIYSLIDLVDYDPSTKKYTLKPRGSKSHPVNKSLKKAFCDPVTTRKIKTELYPYLDLLRENRDGFKFALHPPSDTQLNEQGAVIVYTDGSYSEGKAGSGIYFSDKNPKNQKIRTPGTQTNNAAEIYAAITAILLIPENTPVELRTDSALLVNVLTKRNRSHRRSNLASMIAHLLNIVKKKPAQVTVTKVKAHSGEHGNEMADKLAKIGRKKAENPTKIPGNFIKFRDTLLEGNIRKSLQNSLNDSYYNSTKVRRKRYTLKSTIPDLADKALENCNLHPSLKFRLLKLRYKMISCGDHWARTRYLDEVDRYCPACGNLHDRRHVLIHCKDNARHREALRKKLRLAMAKIDSYAAGSVQNPVIFHSILRAQPHKSIFEHITSDSKKLRLATAMLKVVAANVYDLLDAANTLIHRNKTPPENRAT